MLVIKKSNNVFSNIKQKKQLFGNPGNAGKVDLTKRPMYISLISLLTSIYHGFGFTGKFKRCIYFGEEGAQNKKCIYECDVTDAVAMEIKIIPNVIGGAICEIVAQ